MSVEITIATPSASAVSTWITTAISSSAYTLTTFPTVSNCPSIYSAVGTYTVSLKAQVVGYSSL